MQLLIDGDIVAYKVASACEHPVDWGDGLWTMHSYETEIEEGVDNFISQLKSQAKADTILTALSDTRNFRKEQVSAYYKANRSGQRRPMLLNYARDYLRQHHNGESMRQLEADDVLGIYATSFKDNIIWSEDKDLRTIPAKHLIDGEVVEITEEEADRNFYIQALAGDIVDGYSGCPRIGIKTAEKILDEPPYWEKVVAAYYKAGLSEEVALENARLARILRKGEYLEGYDKEGDVSLWTPT